MHIHTCICTQTSSSKSLSNTTYEYYIFLHNFSYKIKTLISVKDQALSVSLFPKKVLVLSNNYNKAHILVCDYQEAVLGEDQ